MVFVVPISVLQNVCKVCREKSSNRVLKMSDATSAKASFCLNQLQEA
jgi:hypothetical protein